MYRSAAMCMSMTMRLTCEGVITPNAVGVTRYYTRWTLALLMSIKRCFGAIKGAGPNGTLPLANEFNGKDERGQQLMGKQWDTANRGWLKRINYPRTVERRSILIKEVREQSHKLGEKDAK